MSGGSSHINTFDQNVPGFSVTFLLLGMLLGVSLALLDERDWGTLDRLRAMPVAVRHILGAKLLARAQEGDVKAKLIENTQSAVERGAFGSPTFFVGKEMYFGKEQLREVEEMVSK